MRKPILAITIGAAAAIALLTATGSTAIAKRAPRVRTVVVATKKLPKLGTVLVNAAGRTLYIFMPDRQKKVTCLSTCTGIWPPLRLPKDAKPRAAGAAKRTLLDSDPDPGGGRVLTYNRWPLYTYVGDGGPGTANGQALRLNGGLWYAISPSGRLIRTKSQ